MHLSKIRERSQVTLNEWNPGTSWKWPLKILDKVPDFVQISSPDSVEKKLQFLIPNTYCGRYKKRCTYLGHPTHCIHPCMWIHIVYMKNQSSRLPWNSFILNNHWKHFVLTYFFICNKPKKFYKKQLCNLCMFQVHFLHCQITRICVGKYLGWKPQNKKAIVTLLENDTINLFAEN